jgi:methionine synthase II (cobalamin-independent)
VSRLEDPTPPPALDDPSARTSSAVVTRLPPGTATGLGSWPGTDVAESLRVVRDSLESLPHLPELPARGAGADLIGRAATRLVDLPIDLQPGGWRLVDHPGRDQARATAFWNEDLDRLAHAYDGWRGPLKLQLAGPWTLAASLWLQRGERVVRDAGATRDLTASLAEGVGLLLAEVRRLVPAAELLLQLDEPSLPAVLDGGVPTASGFGRLRAVSAADATVALRTVLEAATRAGARTAVHCCAPDAPVNVLRESGAQAVSVDVGLLGSRAWESVATAVEEGVVLWAGVVPTLGTPPTTVDVVDRLVRGWTQVGLPMADLADVVVTPTCGLAGASPQGALAVLERAVEAGHALAERALG